MIRYAVVTNTFNRPTEMVERNLQASLSQTPPPQAVILIDQNPEPLKISTELLKNPLLKVQRSDCSAVSGARNSLVLPPNTEWICFCDDDGYMEPDYAKKFTELVKKNPDLQVIAGAIRRTDNNGFYSLRHALGGSMKKFSNHKLLMGSNFCTKSEVFDRLHRFDENFGAGAIWGSGEESDYALNCFFHRINMTFAQDLVVYHEPPFNEDIRKGFAKSYRYGVGKGALGSKWLFFEKQPLMLIEITEMLAVPFVQILRGIVTLKWGLAVNNVGTLLGRVRGFLTYPFSESVRFQPKCTPRSGL